MQINCRALSNALDKISTLLGKDCMYVSIYGNQPGAETIELRAESYNLKTSIKVTGCTLDGAYFTTEIAPLYNILQDRNTLDLTFEGNNIDSGRIDFKDSTDGNYNGYINTTTFADVLIDEIDNPILIFESTSMLFNHLSTATNRILVSNFNPIHDSHAKDPVPPLHVRLTTKELACMCADANRSCIYRTTNLTGDTFKMEGEVLISIDNQTLNNMLKTGTSEEAKLIKISDRKVQVSTQTAVSIIHLSDYNADDSREQFNRANFWFQNPQATTMLPAKDISKVLKNIKGMRQESVPVNFIVGKNKTIIDYSSHTGKVGESFAAMNEGEGFIYVDFKDFTDVSSLFPAENLKFTIFAFKDEGEEQEDKVLGVFFTEDNTETSWIQTGMVS